MSTKIRRFVIERSGFPDLAGMMLVTIEALREIGGSAHISELDEKVIELEGLSEEEQAFEMSGSDPRLRVNYYLAWARTYLKRGGALENSARGIWSLTSRGNDINSIEQTREIMDLVNREESERARRRRQAAKKANKSGAASKDHNDPAIAASLEGSTDGETVDWKQVLLSVVRAMHPALLSACHNGSYVKRVSRRLRLEGNPEMAGSMVSGCFA